MQDEHRTHAATNARTNAESSAGAHVGTIAGNMREPMREPMREVLPHTVACIFLALVPALFPALVPALCPLWFPHSFLPASVAALSPHRFPHLSRIVGFPIGLLLRVSFTPIPLCMAALLAPAVLWGSRANWKCEDPVLVGAMPPIIFTPTNPTLSPGRHPWIVWEGVYQQL